MKLPRIFNPKLIASLAILSGVVYLLPVKEFASDVIYGILWIIGGILIWLRIRWASILIGLLAIYDLFTDFIPDMLELKSFIENVSIEESSVASHLPEEIIPIVIIFIASLEGFMLFCFIYHGVYSLLTRNHD